MNRIGKSLVGALLALVGSAVGGSITTVGASPSPNQKFDGFILSSGLSGQRVVLSSGIAGRGAFNGIGRVVEIPNLPSDPDSVSRDDLVFRTGTIHLTSTTLDATVSADPVTCKVTANLTQTSTTEGGTGRFAHVAGTFSATVTAHALAQRNPDGSCAQDLGPVIELDVLSATGTMTL